MALFQAEEFRAEKRLHPECQTRTQCTPYEADNFPDVRILGQHDTPPREDHPVPCLLQALEKNGMLDILWISQRHVIAETILRQEQERRFDLDLGRFGLCAVPECLAFYYWNVVGRIGRSIR